MYWRSLKGKLRLSRRVGKWSNSREKAGSGQFRTFKALAAVVEVIRK